MKRVKWAFSIAFLFAVGLLALNHHLNVKDNINGIDFKTGYYIYALCFIAVLFLFRLLGKVFSFSKNTKQSVTLIVVSFFFALCIAEGLLRLFGVYANYMEYSPWDNYISPYTVQQTDWLHVWPFNDTVTLTTGAIEYKRKTNALGLSEKEISLEKDSNEYRIMVLGDSFAEGWGAPADSTWVKLLEQLLQKQFPSKKFTTYNAGVAGSDPVFGYKLFEQKLLKYQPDLVLMTLNNSDEGDMMIHGGLERFQADTTVKYIDGPKWEPIYAASFVFRLIIRSGNEMDDLLINEEKRKVLAQDAITNIYSCIELTHKLAEENNFRFAVVAHPFISEVGNREYDADFKSIFEKMDAHQPPIIYADLLIPMDNSIKKSGTQVDDYFVPNDSHFNSKGYLLFAKLVKEQIISKNFMVEDTP